VEKLSSKCPPFCLLPCILLSALIIVACKPKSSNLESAKSSISSDFKISIGESICFKETSLIFNDILNSGRTEIEAEALSMLIDSSETQPCTVDVSALLNSSSENIAVVPTTEKVFALSMQEAKIIGKLLGIRRLEDVPHLLARLKLARSNGTTLVLNIVKRNQTGLLSSADRQKLLKGNPSFKYNGPRFVEAKVLDTARYNILIKSLESQRTIYLKKFERWVAYYKSTDFKFDENKYIIKSEDPFVKLGIKEIFAVLSSPHSIMRHLQGLEMDIAKRMASKGEKMEDALEALLTAQEKKHGFQPAFDLSGELTREHLQKPALFRDQEFKPGITHGRQIHRIQWYVVTRHLDETPSIAGKVKGAKLFTTFGDGVPQQNSSNWADGWNMLFDSGNFNFGCPEFWRERLEPFLPTLAGWP